MASSLSEKFKQFLSKLLAPSREAAEEHKKQVAHYEEVQAGLGRRYHSEFQHVVALVCAAPDRSRLVVAPDIRRAPA